MAANVVATKPLPAKIPNGPTTPRMNPRVLVVRLGAMGDILHALPAVAMLRRAMPEAHVGWVVEQRWRPLLCAPEVELSGPVRPGRPLLDDLHLVDTRAWRKSPFNFAVRRELLAALHQLRAGHYDSALDLQGAIKSALLARLAGAGPVLGFSRPREAPARYLYQSVADVRAPHVIGQNMELVQSWLRQLGQPPATAEDLPTGAALLPRHLPSETRIATLLDSIGLARSPFAILNPGAGWAAKQWSPSRYGELAIHLSDRGLPSIINYGPGEKHLAERVAAYSDGRALALSTTISELIALAGRAHLFVAGDTGPMHLAALLGVKTIALFGPTDPARNGPYWPSARLLRHPASVTSYSHKRTLDPGLEQLSVGRVLQEVDSLLA